MAKQRKQAGVPTHSCAITPPANVKATARMVPRFTNLDCLEGAAIVRNDTEATPSGDRGALVEFVRGTVEVAKSYTEAAANAKGVTGKLPAQAHKAEQLSTLDTRAARRRAAK